ncbi:MAG: sporulation protein YunB [Clostridia bacterium]|nr:sporulation protein YunB [Clostridia bacterium]
MQYRARRFSRKFYIKIILVLIVIVGLFFYMEYHVRPLLKDVIVNNCTTCATLAVNDSINDVLDSGNYSNDDIVKVEKSSDGEVRAVYVNYVKLNQFKSDVTVMAQKKLDETKNVKVDIPLGLLTGVELLKETGPTISINTTFTGGISADFTSNFESAGLNQTIHTIEANLEADLSVYSTGINSNSKIKTSIIISQTVITGDVPNIYTSSDLL